MWRRTPIRPALFVCGLLALVAPALAGDELAAGRHLLAGRHYRLAAGVFDRLLERDPGSGAARIGLARSLEGLGECERTLRQLDMVRGRPAWTAVAAIAEARCSWHLGDLAGAWAAAEESILLRDDFAQSWFEYGRLALVLGDAEAVDRAEAGIEEHSRVSGGFSVVFEAERLLADPNADLEPLFLELRAPGEGDELFGGFAAWLETRLHLQRGQPFAALAAAQGGLRGIPSPAEMRLLEVEALRRLGRVAEAEELMADRRVKGQQGVLHTAVKARLAVDRGDVGEARRLLAERAAADHPEISATEWYIAHTEHSAHTAQLEQRFQAQWGHLGWSPRTLLVGERP